MKHNYTVIRTTNTNQPLMSAVSYLKNSPSRLFSGRASVIKNNLKRCLLNDVVFQQGLIKQDDKTMCVSLCW